MQPSKLTWVLVFWMIDWRRIHRSPSLNLVLPSCFCFWRPVPYLHLGEDAQRRPVVGVRLLRLPALAVEPVFGHRNVALVEPAAALHARRWKTKENR